MNNLNWRVWLDGIMRTPEDDYLLLLGDNDWILYFGVPNSDRYICSDISGILMLGTQIKDEIIYEGDIIKASVWMMTGYDSIGGEQGDQIEFVSPVTRVKGCLGIVVEPWDTWLPFTELDNIENIEKIGNIYEDPDLLKKK